MLITQSCPTLRDTMDCNTPGSSVHTILQARILEWVAILFSRESSRPRDPTQVSLIADRFFTIWATREANLKVWVIMSQCRFIISCNKCTTLVCGMLVGEAVWMEEIYRNSQYFLISFAVNLKLLWRKKCIWNAKVS